MKAFFAIFALILATEARRIPRTEEVAVEPEVVLPEVEDEVAAEGEAKQVRHHVYMPMPMGPMLYRTSAQAPVIQYVPVYHPDPRIDPRIITFGAGGYANLGLLSAGGNVGVDGNQGSFNFGAGAGLGPNYAFYGQQGVTSLPATTSTAKPLYRTIPLPYVQPQTQYPTPKA